MPAIKLSRLTGLLELQSDDSTTFYNLKTGEDYTFGDFFDTDDYDVTLDDIDESDDYVRVPTKFQINEYEIMRSFIYSLPENRMQDKLFRAIQGRGAFRRFREVLDDYDETDAWYHYRDASIEKIGRDWAEENGIEVIEDIPSQMHYLEDEDEDEVKKILIVVDMQNDFIDGSLGTKEAQAIVPAVMKKIQSYPKENVYATRDTHPENYLETQEGTYLPVKHCIEGTEGWKIPGKIMDLIPKKHIYNKPTFGSVRLAEDLARLNEKQDIEIELVGLCTDICVISNALLLKAYMPEVKISVDPACCAGVTPAKHAAALETMKSCQIQGIDDEK